MEANICCLRHAVIVCSTGHLLHNAVVERGDRVLIDAMDLGPRLKDNPIAVISREAHVDRQ